MDCLTALSMLKLRRALPLPGLLQPLVKELTDQHDPLSCLAALSMLKKHLESISNHVLKSNLATFFLPQLESLLPSADSSIKPMLMQVSILTLKQQQALCTRTTVSVVHVSKSGIICGEGGTTARTITFSLQERDSGSHMLQ